MPVTTNFSWTIPTEGGDSGTWDTILNTFINLLDDDLQAVAGKLNEQLLIPASSGFAPAAQSPNWLRGSGGYVVHGAASADSYYIPINDRLRVGQRITAFTSNGGVVGTKTATVSLIHVDALGPGETVISAGHSLPTGGIAATTTSGLTHDVLADKAYFIKIVVNADINQAQINSVQLTLTKTP